MEYAIYPFLDMRITQRHDEGNHLPHWQGSTDYSDKPWDEASTDGGRQYFVPQNDFIIEQKSGSQSGGYNVRLKSVNKLKIPYQNDTVYLRITLTHLNYDDYSQLSEGQIIHRGEQLIREGTSGQASGNHLHITANIGQYYGLLQNSNGKWCFTYDKALTPTEAFYVDPSITTISSSKNYTFQEARAYTWIARDDYLNQSEMENNANIIISYYRSIGMNDNTIAAILGNMQAESTLSPILNERGGGGGYGLVQWTPKSVLIDHANTLGLTPYTDGDNQIRIIIQEIIGPSSVREWYTTAGFIENYYDSGATSDMIGISGQDFINNTMNWSADKLAIMFMAGYERPSYNPLVNHYIQRMQNALNWLSYMGGVTPPIPTNWKRNKYNFILFNRRRRVKIYG